MQDKTQGFNYVFNAIKAIPTQGTDGCLSPEEEEAYKAQFGQIFDRWASGQLY